MDEPEFERARIPLPVALSWVMGVGWVTGIVVWGWLTTRIENLETGRTTPMAVTTQLEIRRLDNEIDRIESEIARLRAELEKLRDGERSGQSLRGERDTGR